MRDRVSCAMQGLRIEAHHPLSIQRIACETLCLYATASQVDNTCVAPGLPVGLWRPHPLALEAFCARHAYPARHVLYPDTTVRIADYHRQALPATLR